MTTPHDFSVPLWVTQTARHLAEVFASQQHSSQKRQQVYHNTLAVCVVESYLKLLGIATKLSASDSYNPVLQLTNDIADLYLPGKGRIECRPVAPNEEYCFVPVDAQRDRIAYVVVQLDSDLTATLLGFAPEAKSAQLALHQLYPPTALPHHLSQCQSIVDLRQWLNDIYALDWQSPEALLQPQQLALTGSQAALHETKLGAKLISLNLQTENTYAEHRDAVLLLTVTPRDEVASTLSVKAQLHPVVVAEHLANGVRFVPPSTSCLVPNIKLSLHSADGTLTKEVLSRTYPRDNCIQIPQFTGHMDEEFLLKIETDDCQITERFRL